MKKLMCVAALALSLTASGRTWADPADWDAYTPKGERFSACFPSTPTSDAKTAPSPFGDMKMTFYTSMDEPVVYTLGVVDLPKDLADLLKLNPNEALDGVAGGVVNGIVQGAKGKVVSKKKITVGGRPAVDVKASIFGGKGTLRCRTIVTEDRIYLLMVMAPADADLAAGTGAFYDSFQLKDVVSEK